MFSLTSRNFASTARPARLRITSPFARRRVRKSFGAALRLIEPISGEVERRCSIGSGEASASHMLNDQDSGLELLKQAF